MYVTYILPILFCSFLFGIPSVQARAIKKLRLEGLNRSNPEWFESFLGLKWPREESTLDLPALRKKLINTGVFLAVKIRIEEDSGEPILHISVEEKWTAIPVLRFAYGGGTPLKVIGGYNTHAWGRLWTIGAEMRQYGRLSPGASFWLRAPKHNQGREQWGFELRREHRDRPLYVFGQTKPSPAKSLRIDERRFATHYLGSMRPEAGIQIGPDMSFANYANLRRDTLGFRLNTIRDQVDIDGLSHSGFKWQLSPGAQVKSKAKTHGLLEAELFFFLPQGPDLEWAFHIWAAHRTSHYPEDAIYLGGLESIRGLPDSYFQGTKGAYVNVELRAIIAKYKYLWLQSALFSDWGAAQDSWSEFSRQTLASSGIGIRLAVPQVHRLMFRIDYAFGLGQNPFRGINIGMNQLFQPHKPL